MRAMSTFDNDVYMLLCRWVASEATNTTSS